MEQWSKEHNSDDEEVSSAVSFKQIICIYGHQKPNTVLNLPAELFVSLFCITYSHLKCGIGALPRNCITNLERTMWE